MPDIILIVSESYKIWIDVSHKICRPKGILIFNDKTFKELENLTLTGLIHANVAIRAEFNQQPTLGRQGLCLLELHGTDWYRLCLAATFGFVPDNQAKEYSEYLNSDYQVCDAQDYAAYVQACTDMSQRWCWLDIASNHLQAIYGTLCPPIVALTNTAEPIKDLAFYWNLRQQFRVGFSSSIILFPDSEILNKQSVDKLYFELH